MGWYDSFVPGSYKSWSPSRSVSSFFDNDYGSYYYGGYTSTISKESQFTRRMGKILNELTRTANLVVRGPDGEEGTSNFKVTFANEEQQCFISDRMSISPDLILSDKDSVAEGDKYYEGMDALTGRVILGAHIRKNSNGEQIRIYLASDNAPAKASFATFMEYNSYKSIAKDWAGFVPYLETHRSKTHATQEAIITIAPDKPAMSQLGRFVATANYNLVNEDKTVKTGDAVIDQLIEEYVSRLGPTMGECESAVNWLKTKLINDEEEKPKKKSVENPYGTMEGSPTHDPDLLSNTLDTLNPELSKLDASTGEIEDRNWTTKEEKIPAIKNAEVLLYNLLVSQNKRTITVIQNSFQFQENVAAMHTRGLTLGDIDDNALHKVRYDRRTIYERKDVVKAQEHLVGILIDQSGSMRGGRIADARKVAILIYEALKDIEGIQSLIMGHTAQEDDHDEVTMIPYVVPEKDNHCALITAKARLQNIDGIAIKHMAKRMGKVSVGGRKLMLIISDGCPGGYGYGGLSAIEHTSNQVNIARKQGIEVFGIGIENAFDSDTGENLYGKRNFVVLSDTSSSLRVMAAKLKQFLAKF